MNSHLSFKSLAAAVHIAGYLESSVTPLRTFRGRDGAPTVVSTEKNNGPSCLNSDATDN